MKKESVLGITSYWDVPQEGAAMFGGRAVLFRIAGCDAGTYWLTELSPEETNAFVEQWEMWERWQDFYKKNHKAAMKTHPVLPKDRKRHSMLESVLAKARSRRAEFLAAARFSGRGADPDHSWSGWTVRWTEVVKQQDRERRRAKRAARVAAERKP